MYGYASWLEYTPLIDDLDLDFRIKSEKSINQKFDRYYPDHQARKVFNDILGMRAFCDDYCSVLSLQSEHFHVADMSNGKSIDDGYRGVHLYYQINNSFYPIEIQFNTLYDRQLNNWLHDYLYKKDYPNYIGAILRNNYEKGFINNVKDFEEVLHGALSNCKR